MRPQSIVTFERIYWLTLILAGIAVALNWNGMMRVAQSQPGVPPSLMTGIVIGSLIFIGLLALLLWFFIARRASNVAKWIFVAATAYAIWTFVKGLLLPEMPKDALFAINAINQLLSIYCCWLLFRPDAAAWLDSKGSDGPGDPKTFD